MEGRTVPSDPARAAPRGSWLLIRSVWRPGGWLAIFALLLAMQVSPWWRPGFDACNYLSIARSIAVGDKVARLGDPQLFYAPGYPLIVSPAFLLADRPFLIVQGIHWVLAVVTMLGTYCWARRYSRNAGLFVTALLMVNVGFWTYYRQTLSELCFLAFLVWAAVVLNGAARTGTPSSRWGLTLLGAFLVAILTLIRHVGILAALGFAVTLAFEKARGRLSWPRVVSQSLMVALPAAALFCGMVLRDRAMAARPEGSSRTYSDYLQNPTDTLAGQVLKGIPLRASDMGRLLVPGMFKAYSRRGGWDDGNLIVYLPLAGAVAWGWWRLVRRRFDVLTLTFPFYLGLYVVWPFGQATRFLVPMLPLLWMSVWMLLKPAARYWGVILTVLVLGHLGVSVGYWAKEIGYLRQVHRRWPALEKIASPIAADLRPAIALNLDGDTLAMLQFLLDRPLPERPASSPIETNVHWIVMLEGDPPLPGFSTRARAGGIQLVLRE